MWVQTACDKLYTSLSNLLGGYHIEYDLHVWSYFSFVTLLLILTSVWDCWVCRLMPGTTKCMYLHCSVKRDTNSIMLVRKLVQLKGKVAAKMIHSSETWSIGKPTSNGFLLELILAQKMNWKPAGGCQHSTAWFHLSCANRMYRAFYGVLQKLEFWGKKAKPAAIWAL